MSHTDSCRVRHVTLNEAVDRGYLGHTPDCEKGRTSETCTCGVMAWLPSAIVTLQTCECAAQQVMEVRQNWNREIEDCEKRNRELRERLASVQRETWEAALKLHLERCIDCILLKDEWCADGLEFRRRAQAAPDAR